MAERDAGTASEVRRFRAIALLGVALSHAPALAGGLLDADRLLLVKNNEIRSFAGLAALLAQGEPVIRASSLVTRDHAPLGVLSTWLGWQWFRASAPAQHALGLALALAVAAALFSLLSARPALAAAAALGLLLHPIAADLTGPLLGRDALLATWVVLLAAHRARAASAPAAIAWAAAASLAAGLCAPGWGLLGLVPALLIADASTRRAAAAASCAAAALALWICRGDLAEVSAADALGPGAGAAFLAWLPSLRPFVVATVAEGATAGLIPVLILAPLALVAAARAPHQRDAALLRAGAGAMLAAPVASALACRGGTVTGSAAFALHLGFVLALAGAAGAVAARVPSRWALALFLFPALVTAARVRAWADEDRVLAAIVARDEADPEALLARARIELRRGHLDAALPSCRRYAEAAPDTGRADGCLAAAEVAQGREGPALPLLRRWAARFPERRALRAAVLELGEAQPDPRFADAFRRATGFNMPARQPGERR